MPAARANHHPRTIMLAADIEELRRLDAPFLHEDLKRRGWTDTLLDIHLDEACAIVRARQEAAHG